MADGNPLLAVYYRDTLTIRVYEFLNGNFVQIGTGNGFNVQETTSTSPEITPELYWSKNGQRLFFPRKTARTGQVLSVQASVLGSVTVTSGTYSWASDADAKFDFSQDVNTVFFVATENGSYGVTQHRIDDAGLSGVVRRTDFSSNVLDISSSPDGSYFICPRDNNTILVGQRTSLPDSGGAPYTVVNINVGGPTSSAKWLRDGQAVIVVDSTKTGCTVYAPAGLAGVPYDPLRLDLIQTLPSYGLVHRIVTSGDGRTIAIVYNNSGIYTTRFFKSYGKFVVEQKQTVFNNFGRSAEFTQDGLHLIDATAKLMYSFNGEAWVANNTAISAISAGGTVAAVSNHVPNEINVSELYNGAIRKFTDDYNSLDLRLHLLTDAAAFDPNQESIDDFDPSVIILRGDLPDYGLQLSQSKNEQGVNYFVSAPGVNHPVTTSFISTRYAVVYDFNSKKPLIFYDFGSNRIIPVGTRLFISFRDNHLLAFGP